MERGTNENDLRLDQIQFHRAYPLHHIQPVGLLPKTEEAAALWQFLICAFQALDQIESQKTLEGDEDQTVDLMQIAHSCRMIYGLADLNGMFHMNLVDVAKREAGRSRMSWDPRIDAFFESGGKSYRILDRNPDKVHK